MATEDTVLANDLSRLKTDTPVVTNPIPGVAVTVPGETTIESHFTSIANLLRGLSANTSSQQCALERLSECHFWTLNALNDKKNYDFQVYAMEQKKKEEEIAKHPAPAAITSL